jgi:hypothetical protein
MSFKSIGQVANYKPLYRCNIEELAAMQHARPSGGMLFARNTDREEKDAARKKILDLFTFDSWPKSLRILTMPGLDWRFERKLLGKREGDWMSKAGPSRTTITGVENDRYIYYSACTTIPGLHTKRALTRILAAPTFAERTLRTKFIQSFHFSNIDDLMRETTEGWDAVWLDYTGPLTKERLKLISRFYESSVRSVLIVTALKARWNRETSDAIAQCGSHTEWLQKHLHGEVIHDLEYFDTSPMAQFAIRKHEVANG